LGSILFWGILGAVIGAGWRRRVRLLQYTELQSFATFVIENCSKNKFMETQKYMVKTI